MVAVVEVPGGKLLILEQRRRNLIGSNQLSKL